MRTVTMLLGAGVMIATTLMLLGTPQEVGARQHHNERADLALRKTDLFKGENLRKRIGIPMLGDAR